jgi:hypothetical protein
MVLLTAEKMSQIDSHVHPTLIFYQRSVLPRDEGIVTLNFHCSAAGSSLTSDFYVLTPTHFNVFINRTGKEERRNIQSFIV